MQKIVYKLDWFTCIFENCSILDTFDVFGIQCDSDLQKVYSEFFLSSKGYATDVTFNFDGIGIKTDLYEVLSVFGTDDLSSLDFLKVFNLPFRSVRFDISGSALDMLRSRGINVDRLFTTQFLLPEGKSYHVTRADFAFDLINYMPNFVDDCISLAQHYNNGNGRVFCVNSTAIKYSIRTGDQKTIYFGAPRSDKLLRVYDKKLQLERQVDYASKCPYKDEDGNLPQSWIRIELQTRNQTATHLLYDANDYLERFRYIYDHFAIRAGKDKVACYTWTNLFSWDTIPSIIQNANSITYEKPIDRVEKYIKNIAFGNLMVYMSVYGIDNLITMLMLQWEHLQKSKNPLDVMRKKQIISRMYSCQDPMDLSRPNFLKFNGSYDDVDPDFRRLVSIGALMSK